MEVELKCPICQRFFKNPVLLPCFHSACVGCVERGIQPISPIRHGAGHHYLLQPPVQLEDFEGGSHLVSRPMGSSASTTALPELEHLGPDAGRRLSTCADASGATLDRGGKRGVPAGGWFVGRLPWTVHASADDSSSTVDEGGGGGGGGAGIDIVLDRDMMSSLDKMSIVSETDSGVVCVGRSRSASCASSSPVSNLYSRESQGALRIFCPACSLFVYLDDRGVNALPKNQALETLVEKYTLQRKPPKTECQLCEGERKVPAVTMCEQCEVSYCKECLERCHPLRGPLAKHSLVAPAEGAVAAKAKQRSAQLKCIEHRDESLGTFCTTCQVPVCCLCIHSGLHVNHSLQAVAATCKAHKAELSLVLQKLSDRARSASDFLQQVKNMQHDIKANSLEFEALLVAKCDALIESLQTRKRQLLEKLDLERQHKESVFSGQIAQSSAQLQRATGLLQMSIEILRETDTVAFLQISRGLINRITLTEQSFLKDFPMEPKAAPTFDLHLQNGPVLQAIQSLNFYHMKVPSAPSVVPEECSAEQNTVTVSWHLPETSSAAVDGYVLELAEAADSEFREVFCGTESLCVVEGLHFNTKYLARVKAYNHAGESKYSECICLHTAEVAWFTFDPSSAHPDIILTNGNATATCGSTDSCVVLGAIGLSRGVHYWELVVDQFDNNSDPAFGIARFDVRKDVMLGKDDKAWSMYVDSDRSWFMHFNEHHTRVEGGIRTSSTVGVLLDLDHHLLTFYVNKKPRGFGVAFKNLHGVFYPAISINRHVKVTLNSGLDPPFSTYDMD